MALRRALSSSQAVPSAASPFSLFYKASPANDQRLRFRSAFGAACVTAVGLCEFAYNTGPGASTMLTVADALGLLGGAVYLGVNLINSRITVSQLFRNSKNMLKVQTYTVFGNVKQNSSELFPVTDLVFFRKGLKSDYFFVRVLGQKRIFRFDCNADTKPIEHMFKYPQLGQTFAAPAASPPPAATPTTNQEHEEEQQPQPQHRKYPKRKLKR